PALVAFAVGHAVLRRLRLGRFPPLAASGAIGAVVGFAAIFFAPGQGERYEGLATKVSLVGRLLQRGVTSNLDIYRDFVIGTAPVLALIAAALILDAFGDTPPSDASGDAARRCAAIPGTLITATVFVSPKLGPRFYLHSCALVLAAFVGILDATAPSPRRLVPFALVAAFASVYAGVRTVPLFLRLAEQSDERLALLAAAPRGAMVTVESFDQVDDSWWFLGDDLRKPNQRDLI